MARKAKVNITELKMIARGRWLDIFAALAGTQLDPSCQRRHGPCPKCGGTDRFRAIDLDSGALYCNQCFNRNNGDGIAALQWLTGRSFGETLDSLCEYLGARPTHKRNGQATRPKRFATARGAIRYFVEALEKQHGGGVRFVKSWQYPAFFVLRFDLPTPAGEKQRKEFRPVHQVPLGIDGGLGWQTGYPAGPRPLYHLTDVEAASPALLTIHGGEKATDAAAALGLPATCNAGGEKAIGQTDWTPVLRFDRLAIVTDNDPAGEAFGQLLTGKLRRLKPAVDVRMVRLPGLPAKGDIVEWAAAGGTQEQFLQIVAATPIYSPPSVDAEEADDDPHRLARLFLECHSPFDRIVFWRGEYWGWKTYYRQLPETELRALVTHGIKAEFDRLNVEQQQRAIVRRKDGKNQSDDEDSPKTRKVTCRLLGDVIQALRSLVVLPSDTEQQTWLDGTDRPNCINLRNGILDLDAYLEPRDDWRLDHTPNWFSTIHLPYAVSASANDIEECPKWDVFLERVMGDDEAGIKTLQEWAGYCLVHGTLFQKFLILEGEGQNGKSVFCAALTALLGRQNVSNVPLERFGDRFSLSTTLGKLANIATECTEMDDAAEGILKSFTSGDPMQFEVKHKQPFSAVPTARFMMSANNRPRFKDGSGALWRRMLIVKFDQTITEEERIYGMDNPCWWERSGELPGIFLWAVLGLHRLRTQLTFTESDKSKEALNEYRTDTNPAREFLGENCEVSPPNAIVYSADLYAAYSKWCKANGYYPVGERRFGREVKRVFPGTEKKRMSISGERRYYYSELTYTPTTVDSSDLFF